jgi:hypothetical protein
MMKQGRYVVTTVGRLFPETAFCKNLKQVRKVTDGLETNEFRIFKANGDSVVQIARNGHPV